MFIGWISQIIALLDKPESPAVQHLLEKVAEQYPEVRTGLRWTALALNASCVASQSP